MKVEMRSEPRVSNPLLFRPKPKAGFGFKLLRWLENHVFLVALGLPFLVVGGCMMTQVVRAEIAQDAAVRRAQAIPHAEREKILRACVEISRQLGPEEYERIFGESPRNPPIPAEFAVLQAKRVNLSKSHGSIKLFYFFDSGAGLHLDDLDTATPSAVLFWGEIRESEPWVSLKGVQ